MPTGLAILAVASGCQQAGRTANPASPPATAGAGSHRVIARAVDGDTLRLTDGTRVRVLGIDTPERGTRCAGQATSLAAGFTGPATLTADPTQPDRDRYGRLLRYVTVGGRDLGAAQLARGYARPYDVGTPVARGRAYDQLANQAKQARRGLHQPGHGCTPTAATPSAHQHQRHGEH